MRALFVRQFVFLLLGFLLASCAQVSSTPPAHRETSTAAAPYTYWPQETSDIRADPAVRFGVLPNGMHYALMRNSQPAGTVSLRLRIAAGALQERDEQQGLAHFIEHMAFNGSKNVPEGEFVKLLQRKGLAFGADTNAYTNTNETVYMLELPKNDADLVDTGMMLFREISDRLSFDPAAIEREKGVVLSEERTRNSPEYRAYVARWRLSYEGQRQADRLPIGKVETIKGATRDLLLDYYRSFYRPERAQLIATGDFDPAEMEAKIKAKFADWKGEGNDVKDPEQGPVKERSLTVGSYVEPNLPENAAVTWFRPPNEEADSVGLRARNNKRAIALAIINRRLARIARDANAPFIGAGVGYANARGVAQSIGISVVARPGQWQRALSTTEQEYRRALQYGFQQAEVDREVKELRADLEDRVAKAAKRETKELAEQLAGSFRDRIVFSAPSEQLARFEKNAPTITPESALEALRAAAGGQGPLVFVSSGQQIPGGNAAIAAAFDESVKTAVAAPEVHGAKTFPYADFGKPGTVAERHELGDLGLTTLRFANGVMLNVKPTTFEKDTIYVTVRFAGGYFVMPKDKVGLSIVLGFSFVEGGLKRLTADELDEALTGRIVGTEFRPADDAFALSGRTNKRDLQLQLQLLAAYATDPAYRPNGLERGQASVETLIKQLSSGPGRVLSREVGGILHSGDRRYLFPTATDIRALKMADVEATLKPVFASAPIEISVVGDVTVDDAVAAVGTTFGALPARAPTANEPPGARDIRYPSKPASLRFTHDGQADQAASYVSWAAPDFYSNPKRARTVSLMSEIMEVRMVDEFREAQGATYSPSAGSGASDKIPGYGFVQAQAETRPELVEGFYKTVDKIATELKTGAFTDDALTRARTPLIDRAETDRLSNNFWVGAIEDAQSEPGALDSIRTQIDDLKAITKAEIAAAANQYLTPARRIEIRVLPKTVAADSIKSGAKSSKQLVGETVGH